MHLFISPFCWIKKACFSNFRILLFVVAYDGVQNAKKLLCVVWLKNSPSLACGCFWVTCPCFWHPQLAQFQKNGHPVGIQRQKMRKKSAAHLEKKTAGTKIKMLIVSYCAVVAVSVKLFKTHASVYILRWPDIPH